MTPVEVPLDLVHVDELTQLLLVVQMLDVPIEAVVWAQRLLVTFEMQEEYRVEAYQELEQSNVNVGESFCDKEFSLLWKLFIQVGQLLEDCCHCRLVMLLRLGEACQINSLHNVLF